MQMPGQDQIPAPGRDRVERAREMAEEDAQVRTGLLEAAVLLLQPGAWIDACELNAFPALLDDDRRIEQHRPVLEPAELDRPRERVARKGVVVVSEHDVRMRQPGEQRK